MLSDPRFAYQPPKFGVSFCAMIGTGQNTDGTYERQRPKRRFRFGWLALGALTPLLIFFIGFIAFDAHIHAPTDTALPRADAIVVLTGGHARLEPAAQLLEQGAGDRLLVSGVNPNTGASALRSALDLPQADFDCCVDIGYQAADTVGNAREIANWVSKNGYSSIIVVTNDYHMPRSLSEIERVNDQVELIAYPVSNPPANDETLAVKSNRLRVLLGEYGKYIASQLRRFVA